MAGHRLREDPPASDGAGARGLQLRTGVSAGGGAGKAGVRTSAWAGFPGLSDRSRWLGGLAERPRRGNLSWI